MQSGASAFSGAAAVSFSCGQPLHRKALLRNFKSQIGAGTYMRGAAWRGVYKVSEASRPSCAIDEKVVLYEGVLVEGVHSADVYCDRVIYSSVEDEMIAG